MTQPIVQALKILIPSSTFCAQQTGTTEGLHLEVTRVGPIKLPVSVAAARRLCEAGHPAPYGFKTKTLHNKGVRNTWEISRSEILIDQARWNPVLETQLKRLQRDLGVVDGRTLRAELHNLLVYEKGQFFAPHQDSEKEDGMVGTLVVLLPSAFRGGDFVVEHHGDRVHHRGSDSLLTFIAFYADCHHQVLPVTDGFRIALTYNLILGGQATLTGPQLKQALVEELRHAVQNHFETAPPARWRNQSPSQPPDRLVYLLDHQYTQKGLSWKRLKGVDSLRAAVLTQVADLLGCEIFLALADVHESWSCEDEDYGGYGRRRWSRYEEEEVEDDGDDANGHTLVDLNDWDVELKHWVDRSGTKAEAIRSHVDNDEVCFTKASSELEPFKSEHEGYMGNYGNTVDRWYHRAAIALWPRERTFSIHAKASAAWAMGELSRDLKAGRIEHARSMAERLLSFWRSAAQGEQRATFAASVMRVAAALDAPALATSLLQPLSLGVLTPKTAPMVQALLKRYGTDWCVTLLTGWSDRRHGFVDDEWIAALPDLCRALLTDGSADELEVSRWLVRSQLKQVEERYRGILGQLPGRYALDSLKGLQEPMLGLLESSAAVGSVELRGEVLRLLSIDNPTLLAWKVKLLRLSTARHPSETLAALGLTSLYDDARANLTARVNAPERPDDDWSLTQALPCGCGLCKTLRAFLLDSRRVQLEWPLAKDSRQHIHRVLDEQDLPVKHETSRSGRPFTLVLTKTRALFERDAAQRMAWEADLQWLSHEVKIPWKMVPPGIESQRRRPRAP